MSGKIAVRNLRLCTKDCMCLYVCPTGATDTENSIIDSYATHKTFAFTPIQAAIVTNMIGVAIRSTELRNPDVKIVSRRSIMVSFLYPFCSV